MSVFFLKSPNFDAMYIKKFPICKFHYLMALQSLSLDNNSFYILLPDRRDASQWSPMQQRYQSVPPYGPAPGMSPSGTPSMSRQRMSPQNSRNLNMSPVSRHVSNHITEFLDQTPQ